MAPRPRSSSCKRPSKQQHNLLFGQRLQNVDTRPRKQRRNNFERRILGGRADQADVALFHVRKKRILLRFIEAMDFVDEDNGARAVLPGPLGIRHHLP